MTASRLQPALASPIAEEVLEGLSASRKHLPPKLFYDACGSELFERITELPEYYLTRTERGILKESAAEIVAQAGTNLTLVEMGAGSASKTRVIIEAILRRQLRLAFYPVDVSAPALRDAVSSLNGDYPNLQVNPLVADYNQHMPELAALPGRKLALFIGSTIGNFEPDDAVEFLTRLRQSLGPDDAVLLGFDMRKRAAILHPAYDDAEGVTAEFNKNVLARINRELGGQFDLDSFKHVAVWNRSLSRIEMHLESRTAQTVWIKDLGRAFRFSRGERIHTESSYKFSDSAIAAILRKSGLRMERTWTDSKGWFSEVLARV
jgi:L-histidine Nalpha-methyltransferase